MQQLNVLPISLSQGTEITDENKSLSSSYSGGEFSKIIDQHLAESKTVKPQSHSKEIIKTEKTAAEANTSKLLEQKVQNSSASDAADNMAENTQITDDSAKQQEVATRGKNGQDLASDVMQTDPEQLMSFFAKADSIPTHLNSKEEPVTLSSLEKIQYQANLLLKSKSLGEGFSSSDTSLIDKQKQVEGDVSASVTLVGASKDVKGAAGLVKLAVEPIISPKEKRSTADVDSFISNSAISNLKNSDAKLQSLNGNQQDLAKIVTTAAKNVIQPSPIKPDEIAEQDVLKSSAGKLTSAIDNIKQPSPIKPDENQLKQVSKQVLDMDAQTLSESNAITNADTKGSVSEVANAGIITTSANKTITHVVALDLSPAKNSAEQNVVSAAKGSADMATNEQLPKQAAVNFEPASLSKHQDSSLAQKNPVPQLPVKPAQQAPVLPTLGQLTSDHSVEITEQQLENAQEIKGQLTEQNQNINTPKAVVNHEQAKNEFTQNASFIDVTGKATQAAQELVEQNAINMLNPTVSIETVQSQKTNGQLHQETISIFRKDFADAVKDKVMLMISQKLQRFDITLDPPELGNIQVRVNLQGEQAVVNFMVQNQQAKDALEQNMHKLKEMLAEQGVDVGDANVEQQSQQENDNDGLANENDANTLDTAEADDVIEHTLSARMIDASVNAVDYYA